MGQVRFNQESTERQYKLKDKALQMGWSHHAIRVLDSDLGVSGTQTHNREDFKMLVADVSMGKVGAVFVLEASRLSRSCSDWHRLLELCALTDTLIIDEDGCYNPSDFNDQLLLGLKGTMSKAELHFIRARLLGGKINKAKKGELRIHIPVGFCYDDEGNIRFDDNEQVRSVIQLLFRVFKEKGSAYGVVDYFSINKIQFPKRVYGGNWKGKLVWGDLRFSRVYEALRNPSYAGAYVYGRFRHQKRLLSTGQVQKIAVRLPMEAWHTMIKDHHEGYITWEEYIANQKILANNRTNREENTLPTAVREGLGLLQGLLICGCCGRRMNVKYKGKNGVVYRGQTREKWGAGKKNCSPIPGNPLEIAIVKRVLEIMEPAQIEIAVKAFEELEQRGHMLDRQWQMQIKRADYEVQLAQRRYEEVDPSNRLVAATLEKRWNEALIALEEAQRQYDEYSKKDVLIATKQQKEQVLALAQDLPHLWNAESTSARDRKRILRLLIKDITVERLRNEQKAVLHIRWQTNATEDLEVQLPQKICDRWRHSEDIIDRIRQLSTTMTDEQIVNLLNQEGLITNKGNPFTISGIQGIRYKHKIPALCNQKSEEELSVKQVAKKFNVSHDIVRCWIKRKFVDARRIGPKFWISISLAQELELKKYIENSSKITTARLKSQQLIE
ncbi:recombinase family protein [Wolbachia endosymbiont (group B) of Horisme vitalbata]|uniref:recombinase family protein n=1 Tax=Wolbachia endosymbiont (group B) of Horisme vitalbata TaxID=3066178 RepID=UPI003341278E